jgi:hypothetical protein
LNMVLVLMQVKRQLLLSPFSMTGLAQNFPVAARPGGVRSQDR